MKFNTITFFAESTPDKVSKLTAHIIYNKNDKGYTDWPITFRINQIPNREWATPNITIFLESREQLLDFIESIQKAFDHFATEFSSDELEV